VAAPESAATLSGTPLLTQRFHVTMADIDGLGILFYVSPLLWAERLLSGWRREAWIPFREMLATGQVSPVVHTEISYLSPLRMDDEVEGALWCVGRSDRSFTVAARFAAAADGRMAAEVRIKMAFVRIHGETMEPAPLPPDLVAALEPGDRPRA